MAKLAGYSAFAPNHIAVGGVVYNTNRGQQLCLAKTAPVRHARKPALAARARYYNLRTLWSSLTPDEQTSWWLYRMYHPYLNWRGQVAYLALHQYFIRCNGLLAAIGYAPIREWLWQAHAPTIAHLAAAGGPGALNISWTPYTARPAVVHIKLEHQASIGAIPDITHARLYGFIYSGFPGVMCGDLRPGHYIVHARHVLSVDGDGHEWYTARGTVTA